MIASGQKKKIVLPRVEHVDHRHVLKGPLIESLNGLRRGNGPLFDVADSFFFRIDGPQSSGVQPVEQVEDLGESQGLTGFPALLTHS